jgi:hypothetical protein
MRANLGFYASSVVSTTDGRGLEGDCASGAVSAAELILILAVPTPGIGGIYERRARRDRAGIEPYCWRRRLVKPDWRQDADLAVGRLSTGVA